jgi:DNA-binding beta-propeller fold protein YncE
MSLRFRHTIDLPPHETGGFDHADVHRPSGRVFLAHTALGQVDIIDGSAGTFVAAVPGCAEASGVLCPPDATRAFAAARGAGRVLVLQAPEGTLLRTLDAGVRPNGLAWDLRRRHLLVADVQDYQARLLDPETGRCVLAVELPGRPRWCLYDHQGDRFLVNIAAPARVVVLAADTLTPAPSWPVAPQGPHGLALDETTDQVFVACDSGDLVVLDRVSGEVLHTVPIAGPPDVLWLNAARQRLYIAMGPPGVVQVLNTRAMTLVEEIATEEGAHTLTFDEDRQRLYVFLPRSGRAAVYDEM